MASPTTKTDMCNLGLGWIGAKTVTEAQITANTDVTAIRCNQVYEQTRDALQKSHRWIFNSAMIRLASAWAASKVYTTDQYVLNDSVWYKCATAHTSASATEPPHANWTTKTDADMVPDFEWDYMFDLPADFLARRELYEDNNTTYKNTLYSYAIKGKKIYVDDATIDLRYSKKVETVTDFDALFIEVFALALALKLVMPISQSVKLYQTLRVEMYGESGKPGLMSKVRALDKQEQNTRGRNDFNTWNAARRGSGRIASKMGS